MRWIVLLLGAALSAPVLGQVADSLERVRSLESSGDAYSARSLLAELAADNSGNIEVLRARAEFLERHGDPEAAEAQYRLWSAAREADNSELERTAARRAILAALAHGNTALAREVLNASRPDGMALPMVPPPADGPTVSVPGPPDGFLRMAALSTDEAAGGLLTALAKNVVTGGYRATRGTESLQKTEYLKLLEQYLSQARELRSLAGADGTLDIPQCESAETAQLLKILGFRIRNECGPDAVLETVNPSRAFLSIDSGFPLADLELAYRREEPFSMPFADTKLPVLFGADYWISAAGKQAQGEFIDTFLNDPALARLYLAMVSIHRPTANALKDQIEVERILAFAPVLDFFGGTFEVREGRAMVRGNSATVRAWEKLADAKVESGAEFYQRLIEADDGWLASYYDAIHRLSGPAFEYFSEPARLARFYEALRGSVTSPGPARPIFRSNSELMLLTSRTRVLPNGEPYVPGGLGVWKRLFIEHPHGKYDGKLTRSAETWKDAEDLVEALFGLSRKIVENEPLRMYLALSNLDRFRDRPLDADTVTALLEAYPRFHGDFSILTESSALSDATIQAYLEMTSGVDRIRRLTRRADATGTVQALTGLWQILVRYGHIPDDKADATFQSLIKPFRRDMNDLAIFDAGRSGTMMLLAAAGIENPENPHSALIGLLAGKPGSASERDVHGDLVDDLNTRFGFQRLLDLKSLFDLADNLERVARGESFNQAMANRLAARISEVPLPRAELSTPELTAFGQDQWVENHIERQRRLNLSRAVDRAAGNSADLQELRGELAPLLRDTLVGFNYLHYAPPGGELLKANPLFVRSHDFLGHNREGAWRPPRPIGVGWPNSAGGRLIGSLSGLPYALAYAEQNFMVPTERQALIWQDLAPQILLGATVPRWWGVDSRDMHLAALHVRYGREIVAAATLDPSRREAVLAALRVRVKPRRLWDVEQAMGQGDAADAARILTTSELFALGRQGLESEAIGSAGSPLAASIRQLRAEDGRGYDQLAALFGVPHPQLSNSYRLELLDLPLFPTLMGFSSRILAESWESNNLYWAELADELHIAPARLNQLIPVWTQRSIERIFATNLEDWPALQRSMHLIGDAYRETSREASGTMTASAGR